MLLFVVTDQGPHVNLACPDSGLLASFRDAMRSHWSSRAPLAVSAAFVRLWARYRRSSHHIVVHPIMKTVATLPENAGVPEGAAAKVLGHRKPTITCRP